MLAPAVTAHPLDVAVLIAYATAMVAFGLYFYFRVERYSDYYDGGRTWGVFIVGCAVAATNIGAGNTMGSVAMAYRDGLSAGWYVTLQALAFIPFAYIAVHKITRSKRRRSRSISSRVTGRGCGRSLRSRWRWPRSPSCRHRSSAAQRS